MKVVRRKRTYTHSSWVCPACRRSHRKCTHDQVPDVTKDVPVEEASLDQLESLSNYVRHSRIPSPRSLQDVPAETILALDFFVEKITPFIIDPERPGEECNFWRIAVPQIARRSSFVCDAIQGISELHDCPSSSDVWSNVHGQRLLHKTYCELKWRLEKDVGTCNDTPVENVLSVYLVSMLLAVATFHGLGASDAFRVYLNGLQIIKNVYHSALSASVAKGYISATRPPLMMREQRPVQARHLRLLEPLLRCIPSEEFNLDLIRPGSMVHLLNLAINTIHLYDRQVQYNCRTRSSYSDKDTEILFRELCDYQVSYARDKSKLVTLGNQAFQEMADAIRILFEHSIVVVLKLSVTARTSVDERVNVVEDKVPFQEKIDTIRRLDPSIPLVWPEEVLADMHRLDLGLSNRAPQVIVERLWLSLSTARAAQYIEDDPRTCVALHELGRYFCRQTIKEE